MDLDAITAGFIAALTLGAIEVGKQVIPDSYNACKDLIKQNFGEKSKLTKALNELEAFPNDENKRKLLQAQIIESGITEDKECLDAVSKLEQELKSKGVYKNYNIKEVIGINIEKSIISKISTESIKISDSPDKNVAAIKMKEVHTEEAKFGSIEIGGHSEKK